MTRWHNYYLDNHAHFCTSSVMEWQPQLVGDAVQVVYDQWNKARDALGVKILAYVVMPDHYHIVVWSEKGENVALFLRRMLSGIAHDLHAKGGLWKERPRVFPVSKAKDLKEKVDYIHRNLVARGLVTNPEDWEHSSYRQLILGWKNTPFICDDWDSITLPGYLNR